MGKREDLKGTTESSLEINSSSATKKLTITTAGQAASRSVDGEDLYSAIGASHPAATVSSPIAIQGQSLSLVNNAPSPGTITSIDIGVIADSDTVVPTSKAVYTQLAGKLAVSSLKIPFYNS